MNICLYLENKEVLLCHILRCLNVLYVIKRHIEEMRLRKNLDIDIMVLYHNLCAENTDVRIVEVGTKIADFEKMIILET